MQRVVPICKIVVSFVSFFPYTDMFWDRNLVISPSILDRIYLRSMLNGIFHRVVEVGKYFWRSSSPKPCTEHSQLEHVVQSHAQLHFGALHRWRLCDLFGQPA